MIATIISNFGMTMKDFVLLNQKEINTEIFQVMFKIIEKGMKYYEQ